MDKTVGYKPEGESSPLKFEISVLELANYVRPDLKENKQDGYIMNGEGNAFFQYIIDRNNGSTTNASVNKSYTDLIYGRGIASRNAFRNLPDWIKYREVISDEDHRRVACDMQIFGSALVQVIETNGGDIYQIKHLPRQYVCPGKANKKMEIDKYWVSYDWAQYRKDEYKPKEYPAFNKDTSKRQAISIYEIRGYNPSKMYYADPDYLAGLQWAEMEEEIANLYIRSIQQGLTAGYIINVPNAQGWTDEEKRAFRQDIVRKLTGSNNASQFVLSFNGRDVEITITPFPVNDQIHKQWEYLTQEAKQQILTSHRATSPSLVGLISSSGFSNTADEMDTAEAQLVKRVIKPKQDLITNALEDIMRKYGYNLDLYFKPLTEAQAEQEKSENIQMSKEDRQWSNEELELFEVLDSYAQDPPEGYIEAELSKDEEQELGLSAIQNSEQDSDLWKIRYRYAVGTSKSHDPFKSRAFCVRMTALSLAGKVYRKEDIDQMSQDGVNGQFAHSGGKYDIFLYAGGVNCYHRWERVIFKKRRDEDGKPLGGNALQNTFPVNVNEARRQGARIPVNDPDVAKAEIDKPNKGRYNG